MNKSIIMGRLTRNPDIRWGQGADPTQVARYTIAVDRRMRRDAAKDQQTADFIPCVAFGKAAKFAEDYLTKGTKVVVEGRLQSGSYVDQRDGKRVYTLDLIVESQEFAESKAAGSGGQQSAPPQTDDDGFMHIPDGIDDELPFH